MKRITISQCFPHQPACIEYLEEKHWVQQPCCPRHGCKSSFNVLSGTIFERTMVPLPKWFLAIGLMVHAKKNLSSCQLARDVGLNTKTIWFMQ